MTLLNLTVAAYVTVLAILLLSPTGSTLERPDRIFTDLGRPGRELTLDTLQNLVAFAPLGFLLARLGQRSGLSRTAAVTAAVVTCGVFSLGVETFQHWLPGRHSSWLDVLNNTAGAIGGGAAATVFEPVDSPSA